MLRRSFIAFTALLGLALNGCGPAPSGGADQPGGGLVGQVGSVPGRNADDSPGSTQLDLSGKRIVAREELKPPAPAFDFRLTDQSGKLVSLADLKGRLVLVSFIYTNCPESCPLIPRQYLQIQRRFTEAVDDGRLVLVLVTTDPERDTPDRLKRYTDRLGGRWLFLTGGLDEMKEVWRRYEVYREVKERVREVVVYHSYKTYLIDGEGNARFKYTGIWATQDVIGDLDALLAKR